MRYRNINYALPHLAQQVLDNGEEVGSRGGRVKELTYQHVILKNPYEREIVVPGRKANLAAQIAETMWILAGRNDVHWLSHYLPRATEFSDDGQIWRGGYGPRLRGWPGRDDRVVDQLAWVVELMRIDPTTRRAVMSIYDPAIDAADGKDIPCNNWIHFLSRNGYLDMHVVIRSNDLMWGFSGINAFEWSALQEIIAGLLGIDVGELHFSISSLHLYDRHWNKASKLTPPTVEPDYSPRFDGSIFNGDIELFDDTVQSWFKLEEILRKGYATTEIKGLVNDFPEPMMRSWLRVIGWWWTGDETYLDPLRGTALYVAAMDSPGGPKLQAAYEHIKKTPVDDSPPYVMSNVELDNYEQDEAALQLEIEDYERERGWTAEPHVEDFGRPTEQPKDGSDFHAKENRDFVPFVANLHVEKDRAYGDSWKRRGELLAILANIARKVDRLGVSGAGDTAADTAIDLLVYLVKYRLWLTDEAGAPSPVYGWSRTKLSDSTDSVEALLWLLDHDYREQTKRYTDEDLISELKEDFEALQQQGLDTEPYRWVTVDTMLEEAFELAIHLWSEEQSNAYRGADVD